MKTIINAVRKLAGGVNYISLAVCFIMMLLMTADVIGRFVFDASILGTYELAENMLAVIVAFCFADCQVKGRHIHVDMITNMMPKGVQKGLDALCCLASGVFLICCVVAQFRHTMANIESNYCSAVLQFPIWPFNAALTIGLGIFFLTVLVEFIEDIMHIVHPEDETPAAAPEAE